MTTTVVSSATPGSGLPPGVIRGGLGRRFVAQLIDLVVPAILINVAVAARLTTVTAVCVLGILAWEIVVWAMFATRAAGPGMRLVHLQLVRLRNGRAIGWARYLVRALILLVLTVTGIGLLVLIFLLVAQRRHQGLHDLAVQSVVIVARPLAPPLVRRSAAAGAVAAEGAEPVADAESADAEPAVDGVAGDDLGADAPDADEIEAADAESTADEAEPVGSVPAAAEEPEPEVIEEDGAQPAEVDEPEVEPAEVDQAEVEPAGVVEPEVEPVEVDQAEVEEVTAEPAETAVADAESGLPVEWAADPVAARPVPRAEGWQAVLDGDQTLDITRLILIGRNPQPIAAESDEVSSGELEALLIKVSDRARTVSKTHLALDVDEEGPFAIDRDSTNGSAVTDIDGNYRLLGAGQQVRLTHGDVLAFGDHRIEIRHP